MIPGGLQSDNSHQEREERRNIFHKAGVKAGSAARQNRRGRGDNIGSKLKCYPDLTQVFTGGSAQFLAGAQWQCYCLGSQWEGYPRLRQSRQVN